MDHPKIEIKPFRTVKAWTSATKEGAFLPELTGVVLEDPRDGSVEELDCSGAFIAIGHKPITAFLDGQVIK